MEVQTKPLPREQAVETARTILNTGGKWRDAIEATGWSDHRLRCELNPNFRERRREQIRINLLRRSGEYVPKRDMPRPLNPPQERLSAGYRAGSTTAPPAVLAERDRAMLTPRTLTATLLGDPPAGRSALDKRR